MFKRSIPLILVVLLHLSTSAYSQSDYEYSEPWIVSPGVRIGYAFGAEGGLLLGLELSMLAASEGIYTGFVLNADYFRSTVRLHLGGEIPFLEFGPSVYLTRWGPKFALDGTLNIGLGLDNHGGYGSYTYAGIFDGADRSLLVFSYKYYTRRIDLPYLGT